MTIERMIEIIGIKKPTKKLLENKKMYQLYKYYILNDDVDIYDCGVELDEKAFLYLLNNMHSVRNIACILSNVPDMLNINYNTRELSSFYNLYDPEVVEYSTSANILIDEEYLKYASKEWTEDTLLNQEKVLHVGEKKMVLRENAHKPYEDEYIPSFTQNLEALKKAKDSGRLEKAIERLSE